MWKDVALYKHSNIESLDSSKPCFYAVSLNDKYLTPL